ncbi:MAG: phosphopantetheine-binding protein, partial [Shewanella sp.]
PQVQWVDRIVEKEVEKEVIVEKLIEKTVEKVVLVENTMNNNHNSEQTPLQPSTLSSNANRDILSAFFSAQTEAAQLHQQFLAIPKQYGETFTALMIEQAKMASQGITIPESLQRSMELFHQHQAQTLQSHTEFLQQQSRHSQAALALLTQAPMVASEPLKGEARTLASQPQERPFATQSAPSSAYAHVTPPPVAHQSVQHQPLERQTFQPQPNALATPVLASAPRMGADNAQQTGARQTALQHTDLQQNNIQQTNVQQTMLAVVADKTGYPTDMLELSMDMEADLGIDSIKRVEILGTVQDALPGLPELNPSDLAECRTLGEIVNYMNANLPAASLTATAAANTNVTAATRSVPVAQILPEKEFA